jgi:hypothetical protein
MWEKTKAEMKVKIKSISQFAIIISVLIISLGCSDHTETRFKDIAKELRIALIELQAIEPTTTTVQTANRVILQLDLSDMTKFVDRNKDTFDSLAGKLETFSHKYRNSTWRDDADFLLVMEYLSVSIPGNDYHSKAIENIEYFLKEHPRFEIEDWTKNYFKDIYIFHILDKQKISNEALFGREMNLTVNQRIEAFLLLSIVNEHLKGGDLIGAEREAEGIKNHRGFEWIADNVNRMIREYEEHIQSE